MFVLLRLCTVCCPWWNDNIDFTVTKRRSDQTEKGSNTVILVWFFFSISLVSSRERERKMLFPAKQFPFFFYFFLLVPSFQPVEWHVSQIFDFSLGIICIAIDGLARKRLILFIYIWKKGWLPAICLHLKFLFTWKSL